MAITYWIKFSLLVQGTSDRASVHQSGYLPKIWHLICLLLYHRLLQVCCYWKLMITIKCNHIKSECLTRTVPMSSVGPASTSYIQSNFIAATEPVIPQIIFDDVKHPKSNSPLVLLNLPISVDLLTIRGRMRCCSRMLLMRPAPWNAAGWVESKMGIGKVMDEDEDPIPLNILLLVYIYIIYISSIRGPRYEKIQSQIMVYNWFLNARGIGWSNLQDIKHQQSD